MDLAAAFTNLEQAKTMASVQMAVAAQILKNQRSEGSSATKLLQAADNSVAQAGDELTAAATGLGGALDTYA
jgi:hypothetical protein